jgi:hypothetical protein
LLAIKARSMRQEQHETCQWIKSLNGYQTCLPLGRYGFGVEGVGARSFSVTALG